MNLLETRDRMEEMGALTDSRPSVAHVKNAWDILARPTGQ
jgi:hypothetical protein